MIPIEVVQLKRLEPDRVREGFSQSPPSHDASVEWDGSDPLREPA